MGGLRLEFTDLKQKLPVGASKLMGNPDVWEGFVWPGFTENGQSYDLTFLGQINCFEAASFAQNGLLPATGILYFFYDLDGMPEETGGQNAARVLYYNGDAAALCEILLTDHAGNNMSLPEMKICFGAAAGSEHAVIGGAVIKDAYPLLRLYGFETSQLFLNFKGKRSLCFYVNKNDLAHRDFSAVCVRQE